MNTGRVEVNRVYRKVVSRSRQRIGDVLGTETGKGRVMVTTANGLTLGRLAIVPFFWYCFFSRLWWLELVATLLFAFGALTDLWDGILARRRDEVTAFGNFMDPLADKLLVLSAYWALLIREDFGGCFSLALIMIGLITVREISLTLLRIWAIGSGSAVVTSVWGKLKTGIQLVTLLLTLAAMNLRDLLAHSGRPATFLEGAWFFIAVTALLFLCSVTSLVSGALYFAGMAHRRG